MRIIIYHALIAMMFWSSQNVTVIKNFPCHNISANNDCWIIILGESLLTATQVGIVSIYSWFYCKKREHWVKPRFFFFLFLVLIKEMTKSCWFSRLIWRVKRFYATPPRVVKNQWVGKGCFKWGERLWMHGICKYRFIYRKIWSHLKD